MRILHFCRQYHPSIGGVERFIAELATRTAARGHRVEIATLNRLWRRHDILSANEVVNGVPVHRLPFVGGALFFAAPGALRLADSFDVLHVHNTDFFLDFLSATQFIHRRPFIVSTHGGYFHTTDYMALKQIYFALITRFSLRAASIVIPNSASDERRFAPHARMAVRIDNAIDYAAFARVSRRCVPGRLITVGRLAPNKNVGVLLKIFAAARAARPDLSLIVVGDGPLKTNLQAQAARLGVVDAVQWLGEVSDARLRAELGLAEVFVSAARHEGFGLALIEAMATGVIPVVNNIEAFCDLIADTQDGFLADYADVVGAVRKLLDVLAMPEEQKQLLSAAGKESASKYDWEKTVMKFEAAYARAFGIGGVPT